MNAERSAPTNFRPAQANMARNILILAELDLPMRNTLYDCCHAKMTERRRFGRRSSKVDAAR